MLETVFAQIIPLTVAMALPKPVLKATRYLLHGRPILHSVLLILTWGLSLFIVLYSCTAAGILIKEVTASKWTYDIPYSVENWIHVIVGLAFIVLGMKKLQENLTKTKKKVSTDHISVTLFSVIRSVLILEFFSIKNTLLILLIVNILMRDELPLKQLSIATGLISLTAMLWISMPLLAYFLAGHKRNMILELFKAWLMEHKNVLIIFIYIFIGISSLSSGLGSLMASVLESIYKTVS